jgi:hypothetical protein
MHSLSWQAATAIRTILLSISLQEPKLGQAEKDWSHPVNNLKIGVETTTGNPGNFGWNGTVAQSTNNGSDVDPNTDLKFATIPVTVGRGKERSLLLR